LSEAYIAAGKKSRMRKGRGEVATVMGKTRIGGARVVKAGDAKRGRGSRVVEHSRIHPMERRNKTRSNTPRAPGDASSRQIDLGRRTGW